MASPTNFQEQNHNFTDLLGLTYPVLIRETKLGDEDTVETLSAWQMSHEEMAAMKDNEHIVFLSIAGGQPPVEIIGGDPVPFEGQNAVYTHPDCRDLPVHRHVVGESFIVTSAWQLNRDLQHEIQRNGGIVFLRVIGGQPLVKVSGFNPIR